MPVAAGVKSHRHFFLPILLVCLFHLPGQPLPALAQQAIIQRIEIVGNRRIPRDTLKARIFSREGDPYNEDLLRRDFQALWNTQFFEDIRLEVEESPDRPNAKIVLFYVKERPVIRRIEYKGIKSVTESEILERFKDRKVGLSVESQFDPTRIKRAEVVLQELLAERGRQFAVIKPTYERIAATNAIKLTFNVEEGPKVKVGKILIQGNTAFSSRKIIRAMRHSRPYAIPLGITSLNLFSKTYDRRKLSEDLEIGIRGLYQDHGYFKVLVKDPVLETEDVNRAGVPGPWPLVGHKRGKRTNITIPIEEGERFHLGKLFVRSADPDKGLFFKTEYLQKIFPVKEGDIFAVDKIRKAL
jgi:outer membrane protein insertion porin family